MQWRIWRHQPPVTLLTLTSWACVLFALLLIVGLSSPVDAIKCYECANESENQECNKDSNIVDCELKSTGSTRYDACQTKLSQRKEGGVSITKRCVVRPCVLGGSQDAALGLSCDRSTPVWECESCCETDLCNVSRAAAGLRVHLALVMASVLLPLLLLMS